MREEPNPSGARITDHASLGALIAPAQNGGFVKRLLLGAQLLLPMFGQTPFTEAFQRLPFKPALLEGLPARFCGTAGCLDTFFLEPEGMVQGEGIPLRIDQIAYLQPFLLQARPLALVALKLLVQRLHPLG